MHASAPGLQLSKIAHRRALVLAIAVALTGCATPPSSIAAGGNFGRLDIVRRGDGSVLPTYATGGRYWVVGTPGEEYAVRVCNSTSRRLLAVVSVDGVNAITGDTAAPSQSGYVLDGYQCADIDGWRKSLAQTAAFYFTELPDAYATRTGRPQNVGVVGVAFFPEKRPPVAWKDRQSRIAEGRADAPTTRNEAAAQAPSADGLAKPRDEAAPSAESSAGALAQRYRDDPGSRPAAPAAKLGTGHGRMEDSPAQMVAFERASPYPAETIAIHYDRRENLVAMGVLPPPVIAQRPANPFPGSPTMSFAPNPPR